MTRLTIGIDGYHLARPHGTGATTYGFGLVDAIRDMGHLVMGVFGVDVGKQADTHELLFYENVGRERPAENRRQRRARTRRELLSMLRQARAAEVPMTEAVEKRAFAERLPALDRLVSLGGLFDSADRRLRYLDRFVTLHIANPPDIMHWTHPLPVRVAGAKNIYTLHDVAPLKLPFTTLDQKDDYRRLIHRCITSADHICTVSESSRKDILQLFHEVPAEKVTNSYQTAPVSQATFDRDPAEDARFIERLFGLRHRNYFLFFGTPDPTKNLDRIIESYQASQSTTPLVIVAPPNGGKEQGSRLFGRREMGVYGGSTTEGIRQLDYLPRSILLRLARGAKAVLFPSLYEGFGLPALEAIRLGTPVISSTTSPLPEVVGDAGLLVDPYDSNAIAEAIRAVDTDPAVAQRLIDAGPAHVAKFSEDAYRQRLAAMYERVLQA